MSTIYLPTHVNVLVRPGVGVQCGVLPESAIILPLPEAIAAGHVAQVLSLARQPMPSAELAKGLEHCGFEAGFAHEVVAELLQAKILRPYLGEFPPIFILDTGVAAAHTAAAFDRIGVAYTLTDEPTRAGASILLTGGEVFPPADVQYSLMTHRVPHFPHGIVDGRLVLGPMIIPGSTPCLACFDALYSSQDSGWKAMRIQAGAKIGARNRFDLETAASTVARLVRDRILPWRKTNFRVPTTPPPELQVRRLIELSTLESTEEREVESFHAQCRVCDTARLHRSVHPSLAPALAVVGHDR